MKFKAICVTSNSVLIRDCRTYSDALQVIREWKKAGYKHDVFQIIKVGNGGYIDTYK